MQDVAQSKLAQGRSIFKVDIDVALKRHREHVDVKLVVDQRGLYDDDPFQSVTLSNTSLPKSIKDAFDAVGKLQHSSPIIKGLINFGCGVTAKFDEIHSSPWTDTIAVETQLQELASRGSIEKVFKQLVRELEARVPGFLTVYRERGLLGWVESGFNPKKLPCKLTVIEPGSDREHLLNGFDGNFDPRKNLITMRGPGPNVLETLRFLAVTGCMPASNDVVLHEVAHSQQDFITTQLSRYKRDLRLATAGTLVPLAADLTLHALNAISTPVYVAGLALTIGTFAVFKIRLDQHLKGFKDAKAHSTVLGEAHAYEDFGLGINGIAFHRTPAKIFGQTISMRYEHEQQSAAMPHEINLSFSKDRPNSLELKGLESAIAKIAYDSTLQRLGYTAFNSVHTIRLMQDAAQHFGITGPSQYTTSWLDKIAQRATLDQSGNYTELQEAINHWRAALDLSDDSVWEVVAPALYAWDLTQKLYTQHKVREITRQHLAEAL